MPDVSEHTSRLALNEVVTLRTLRRGAGKASVVCIHPISGMVTAYAQFVRCISRDINALGIEADREFSQRGLRVGVRDLAIRYARWVQRLAEAGPTTLLGWCIGADIAVEILAVLPPSLRGLVEAVAIDPNFSIDDTFLSRNTACGGPKAEKEFWKFFILMACGAEFAETVIRSKEFIECQNDEERVEHVYLMRRILTNRGAIKIETENPCWQIEFIRNLTEQSRGYRHPTLINFPLTIVAASKDGDRAKIYADAISGPLVKLSLVKSDHYQFMEKPIISQIARDVENNIGLYVS